MCLASKAGVKNVSGHSGHLCSSDVSSVATVTVTEFSPSLTLNSMGTLQAAMMHLLILSAQLLHTILC